LTVQINAGLPQQIVANNATPSDVPLIISGNADEVIYEPHHTSLIINGRDYISLFADNKVGQSNVTPIQSPISITNILGMAHSSDVITQLAIARGLTPVVTQTTNPLGKYFQTQYSMLNAQITEWDLMTYLARQEGYDIFVIGKNLFFQPKSSTLPYQITIAVPYYTTSSGLPISNVEEITFTRNYRLAKNIIVKVSSWNIKDKAEYNATATLIHTATIPSDTQIYNYVFPNLSQDQCSQKALTILQDISQHEMTVNIRMPADNLLTAHSILAIKDTGTIFDQNYHVKSVMREMDFNSGFIMSIEAKFRTPATTKVTPQ
jgi:hypothetical protein